MIAPTPIESAFEQLRAGRPVLVADSVDRENEVDAVLAASTTTTEWIAWTIRYSSGYVCAPMTEERADALELPLMVAANQDPRRTAYTVSVDAASGVTTGISAADRRKTLAVLADPTARATALVRPGHVLPLRARDGGVLTRQGHTEATVDLCIGAGLEPVGAIAELVNDDGTMMRLPQAIDFAAQHALVVVTMPDLIAWRQERASLSGAGAAHGGDADGAAAVRRRVRRVASASLPTAFGDFIVHCYRDPAIGADHLALVPTSGVADEPIVRVHSECLTGDALGSLRCDCGPQLAEALRRAATDGGVVVYLRGHEGRGIGLAAKIAAYQLQDHGRDTVDANLDLGLPVDSRDYAVAGAILADLGITSVRLLTNNPEKVRGLAQAGVDVSERVGLHVGENKYNERYLQTKVDRMGHLRA